LKEIIKEDKIRKIIKEYILKEIIKEDKNN
jgi:hypothetical protein